MLATGLRWLRRAVVALLALGLAGVVAVALVLRHYEQGLPTTLDLKGNYHPPQVTRVLARDGMLLAELFTERRTVVPIASLPAHVKLAVLAAEDVGFYEHRGFDARGLLRALVANLRAGRTRQGGSTITQQVVKNLLLDPERTYARKIREVILARRLEEELTKDEILELYLNHIYFGHGRYGIEEAARNYFGKPARSVTLGEAALLAGLPAGPELYSPRHDLARSTARRAFVLGQMRDKALIDRAAYDAAMAEPVRLAPPVEAQAELAPEAVEIARRTLREVVGERAGGGGYTITTTIDARLQAAARKAVRDELAAYDKRAKLLAPFAPPKADPKRRARPQDRPFEGAPKHAEHRALVGVVTGADDASGTLEVRIGQALGAIKLADDDRYNPQHLPPSQFAAVGTTLRVSLLAAWAPPAPGAPASRVPLRLELGPEAAMVTLDARSREVLALVGSYEAAAGALDRATQSHRQPGSSFKPVVYAHAIVGRRFTPATLLDTHPGTLGAYRPSNFEDSEGKEPMRLREALAHSVNVAAVHVLESVGPASVVEWAAALGVQSKLGADLSLALGAYEVTPMEMAGAYATFAAGGVYQAPHLVTRIVGPDGVEVPLPPRPAPRRVMTDAEAYVTTSLLASVIDHGTGASARALARPLAGKTGTSNQAKDAWFVGYSTDVVCATWTGYDDPRTLGAREAGATAALPAWIAFMRAAHEKKPPTEFARPDGVVTVAIDPKTGLLAAEGQEGALDEVFLAGTEPTEHAPVDAGTEDAGLVTGAVGETDAGEPTAPATPAP